MATALHSPATRANGFDVDQLNGAIAAISADPAAGQTRWQVTTRWMGGTCSDTRVRECGVGGQRVGRDFMISIDEPLELCGTNQFANPQECLLAALNGCMVVGFAAVCALKGITIHRLTLETEGDIDLRGFLGLSDEVPRGYGELRQTVLIDADADEAALREVHEIVKRTSPNFFNLSTAVATRSALVRG